MDTCIHLVAVGRNTDFDWEVVVVYFYLPQVVLCGHLWVSVELEVAETAHFSVCLGSLTSSSVLWANLATVIISFTHQSLMYWQCLKSHHL